MPLLIQYLIPGSISLHILVISAILSVLSSSNVQFILRGNSEVLDAILTKLCGNFFGKLFAVVTSQDETTFLDQAHR